MELLTFGALDITQFCSQLGGMIKLAGFILTFFKIAIPLVIVALGMFDFGKAVIAEKEDEIKKQTKRLIYRVIAGLVIFFVPSIIMFIFRNMGDYGTEYDKIAFDTCETCLLHPTDCPVQ